jgi:hypothetical protein
MANEIAQEEFGKLHDEIVEACSPSEYPTDSVTNSLFAKAKMLIDKFYDGSQSRTHFENELNSVKRKTNGYNNYQKLYGLEKFIANVILEDLRISAKFKRSNSVDITSNPPVNTELTTSANSRFDRLLFWIKNHPLLSVLGLGLAGLILTGNATDALVKLGILKDDTTSDLQRQEFFSNNPPQFELWYSAFYPDNRDPLLKRTLLDDTTGITGSYRLVNKGRAIVTLEEIKIPNSFKTRGYFTDQVVKLPYALSPSDTIVISCELPGKELPIIETENALKKNVSITCSYPVAEIRFTYKFHWREGLFRKARVIME